MISMIIAIVILTTVSPIPTPGTVGPHGGGRPGGRAAPGGPAAAVDQPGETMGGDRDAGAAVAEPAEEGAGRAAG